MVVDDAGQAVRMVGTGQDITKHTREQLVPFEATYAPGTWTSTQLPHSPPCFGFMQAHKCLVFKEELRKPI
jgi:hypothetical protein